MIRLAANLSFLFTELPFLDRFEAAESAGFKAVEFTFADDVPVNLIANRLRSYNLKLALFNVWPGDMKAGEIGLAVLPHRREDLRAAVDQSLERARALNAPLIHFLAGNPPDGASNADTETLFLENLCWAADRAAEAGIVLTLEPLNGRDRPDYFIQDIDKARKLIAASKRDNVGLQLDLYHCALMQIDAAEAIEQHFDLISHVQIAAAPNRDEPSSNEEFQAALARLDTLGYAGFVGCEYKPASSTLTGLRWAAPYLEAGFKSYD